jgi:DNA-binding MarR family transcriptional regulator
MYDANIELYARVMDPLSPASTSPMSAPETAEDALMSLLMALGRQMRQRQPGDAVDYSAFPILKLLSHQGPLRVSALAHALGLDASTVSRHARQLEDRGLLERTDDPDDRRASQVALSELGGTCLVQAFESRRHVITSALDGWTDEERETLRVLTGRLVQSLAPRDSLESSVSAAPEPVAAR